MKVNFEQKFEEILKEESKGFAKASKISSVP